MLGFLLFTLGCAENNTPIEVVPESSIQVPEPTAIISAADISASCSILLEDLSEQTILAANVDSYRQLLQDDQGVAFFNESTDEQIVLGNYNHFDGVALSNQTALLALDGTIHTFDGDWLFVSPIDDLLPVPISSLHKANEAIWFWGAGQLFRWQENNVKALELDEQSDILSFHVSAFGQAYLSTPQLLIVDTYSEPFEIIEYRSDVLPKLMTTDQEGTLWLTAGDSNLRRRSRTGQWGVIELDANIQSLMANHQSNKLWLQTEQTAIVHHNNQFCTVEVPEGQWLSVDHLGRLLILANDVLTRVSIDRPVAVVGLMNEENLAIQKEIQFIPTQPETVDALSVWVGEKQLHVDQEPWRTILDPEDFAAGFHDLRIVTQGPEGTTIGLHSFVTGDLPDVTWADIAPILQDNCLACHHEHMLIPLDTRDLWQINIDTIIEEVSTESMPLGGPFLSEQEIITIRAWKQGGFQ